MLPCDPGYCLARPAAAAALSAAELVPRAARAGGKHEGGAGGEGEWAHTEERRGEGGAMEAGGRKEKRAQRERRFSSGGR